MSATELLLFWCTYGLGVGLISVVVSDLVNPRRVTPVGIIGELLIASGIAILVLRITLELRT